MFEGLNLLTLRLREVEHFVTIREKTGIIMKMRQGRIKMTRLEKKEEKVLQC